MRIRFAALLCAALVTSPAVMAQSGAIDDTLSGRASENSARAALDALTAAVPNPVSDARCLPDDAMRADVMNRLHTQLMMASLACQDPWNDQDLYEEYVNFTIRMEPLLTDALGDMEQYFRQTQTGSAFDAFNSYRTALANEEAAEVRTWGAATYCNIMISRYTSLIDASPNGFEGYVEDIAGRALSRVGVCE